MSEINAEVIAKIQELVLAGQGAIVPLGANVPYTLVPQGYKVEGLGGMLFNEHSQRPERIKQTVTVLDPVSFVEYYKQFSDPESRVFAYEPSRSVTAVLDYHESATGNDSEGTATARWGQHKLVLSLRHSEEWTAWTGQNNKQMTQAAFAEFLEQNSVDVSDPSPAHMREIASDMQATIDVDFGGKVNRANGQVQLRWTEAIKASVGNGQLAVPEHFTLNLPVFVGGPRISLDALLRFRLKDSKLTLWFSLVRPEDVMRKAFQGAREEIAGDLSCTIINGQVG